MEYLLKYKMASEKTIGNFQKDTIKEADGFNAAVHKLAAYADKVVPQIKSEVMSFKTLADA